MEYELRQLDLEKYRKSNNIRNDLNENEVLLHWLRYRKLDIIFRATQIYISQDLYHFDRIKNLYNFHDYYSRNKPALFFGVYNDNDLNMILNHQGERYIMWGGTDCDIRFIKHREIIAKIMNIRVVKHFAISKNIQDRLSKIGISTERIELNLTNTDYFKPLKKKGDYVYIYNGYDKGNEHIYGEEEYTYVVQKLNKFLFIYSHGMKLPYNKMANLYKKCFIGLRLTKHDGSANTVSEMQKMGLNVVHNGEFNNTLPWKNTQDIITHIHSEYLQKKDVKFSKLNFKDLNPVMKDIEIIDTYIQKYKTILFICSDYPGWGGAATNCYELIKHYKKQGINVYGIFWCWSMKEYKQIDTTHYEEELMGNIIFTTKSKLKNVLYDLDINPELVILRNMIYEDLNKYYSCPIFLFLPGLFTDKLDQNYKNLNSKTQILKFINKQMYKTISSVDMVFVNNHETQKLLKTYFDINSILFYFNLIPYLEVEAIKDKNFNERTYDYGIIVSDFDRKIKNIPETLKRLDGNILLIGKNSKQFESENITCLDLISNTEVKEELKKIKKIVLDSHYEGCSNVLIEAYFAGCKI